jgi:type IV fimbrial biogenesis protein FimT
VGHTDSMRAGGYVEESHGFTLIELVVTIAVLAILLGIGIPSLSNFIQSNRVSGHANGMVSALHFARSEAVNRSEAVRFCPVNEANDDCREDGDWAAGWVALVQSGADAGQVLRVWQSVPGSLSLEHSSTGALDDGFIDLLPLGNVASGAGNFTYRWTYRPSGCDTGRPFQRRVEINRSGRAQVLQESC